MLTVGAWPDVQDDLCSRCELPPPKHRSTPDAHAVLDVTFGYILDEAGIEDVATQLQDPKYKGCFGSMELIKLTGAVPLTLRCLDLPAPS